MTDNRTQRELAADGAASVSRQLDMQQVASGLRSSPYDYAAHVRAVRQALGDVKPGDWLNSLTSAERKDVPLARGLLDYFPDALAAVARHSKQGNDKHNPGQPLHWSREKSGDHADCIARHLAGRGKRDAADGSRHSIGLAWRALALLQLEIEDAVRRGEEV